MELRLRFRNGGELKSNYDWVDILSRLSEKGVRRNNSSLSGQIPWPLLLLLLFFLIREVECVKTVCFCVIDWRPALFWSNNNEVNKTSEKRETSVNFNTLDAHCLTWRKKKLAMLQAICWWKITDKWAKDYGQFY